MKNQIDDYKVVKAIHARMSWFLMECDVLYYGTRDHPNSISIHKSWKKIRSISDEEYEQKKSTFNQLSELLKEKEKLSVSIDPKRPSVKMALDNMSKRAKRTVQWPSEAEQSVIYLLLLESAFKNALNKLRKIS